MKLSSCLLTLVGWVVWSLWSCAPVVVQEEGQEMDQERFRVNIAFDPAVPQAITGFVHLGRVYSLTMASAGVGLGAGSPRDLDAMIDAINELTDVRAEFASSIPYSDPRLFDLPLIIPQSAPNEVEMEQLVRYLLEGGFVMDLDMGFDTYRNGLEKYGELVWGRDAWTERLADDHPVYTAFFKLEGGVPQVGMPSVNRGRPEHMQGLFVNGRLAGVKFALREPPIDTNRAARLSRQEPDEEVVDLRNEPPPNDFRRRQMAVNVVVYALIQEGSLARKIMERIEDIGSGE